jgi:nitrogen regulatory protein PII
MKFKYVIAIVRPETVPLLEARLAPAGIRGLTLTKVKGFGEYKNFFTSDWLSNHMKVEILTEETRVQELLDVVQKVAGSDLPGTGVVAVMPVDTFFHLRAEPQPVCAA